MSLRWGYDRGKNASTNSILPATISHNRVSELESH